MNEIRRVTDEKGHVYELEDKLGQGGQGVVYAVRGGRLAVKILQGTGSRRRETLRNRLVHVRCLPLDNLSLAKPLEMLRPPHTGYVMERLTGMSPAKSILRPAKNEHSLVEWYHRTGGVRRRLLLLGRAAQLLARLHARGLVYSDPSPSNIFVSDAPDACDVWLIDTDNLQYESSPHAARQDVYTPGFAAPELMRGTSGVTTLSDAYAFAVVAFQVLTVAHPFVGNAVAAGEPEWEERAFAGNLPWIEDPDDMTNRADFGLPSTWVLSPRVRELFRKTFGGGRTQPRERPGMAEWTERLFTAADATLTCPACRASYYFSETQCPWCNRSRPGFVLATIHLWDPVCGETGGFLTRPGGNKEAREVVGYHTLTEGETHTLTRRHAHGAAAESDGDPVITVTFGNDRVTVQSMDGVEYKVQSPTGRQVITVDGRPRVIKLDEHQRSWQVHFGERDSLHRVLTFELRSEASR